MSNFPIRALLIFCFIFAARAQNAKPNVLVLFTDDQRADTIAALGNPHIKTPALDRLVKHGTSFQQAYMQGGMQGATCVPSRAMLLSGRSLFHIDEKLLAHQTWPARFGEAGYSTFVSGKWHNGNASVAKSFQQARSMFTGGMTNPLKAPLNQWKKGIMQPAVIAKKHACEIFADEAIRFIEQKHKQPFFCYVPFDGPHDPHIVPDEFPIHYDPATIPLPKNFLPQHPFNNGEMTVRDEELLPWPRDEHKIKVMIAEYYRYISFLDAQVGRILDALEKSPFAKNTYVVFASDSGVARGSHGLIGKQNLYEHSIRVPLIITGPGVAANQRSVAKVYTYDIMATLGKLCAVSAPATNEGKDFSAILSDASAAGRDHLFFAYRDIQRSIHDGPWKVICYPKINKIQLFNLENDAAEIHDLAASPAEKERLALLMQKLRASMDQENDRILLQSDMPEKQAWQAPTKKTKAP